MQTTQYVIKKKGSANSVWAKSYGFTLTEIAIVLGIIGVILGAIWVAAGSVNSNQKVVTATGQVMTILQGIRSLYATSASVSATDGTSITVNLCSANIFPSSMIASSGCGATIPVLDPWNGAVTVASASVSTANVGDAFSIQMAGIDQRGCVGLLTSLGETSTGSTTSSNSSGIIYLNAGTTAPTYSAGTAQPSGIPFPITPVNAATVCGNRSSSNIILAVFKLKG